MAKSTDINDASSKEGSTGQGDGDLELKGLRKVFDDGGTDVVAVDDFNLTIEAGEFAVLVGPSGCGKTTTLRMVAGLEEPTSGKLLLDGENIVEERARERDVAMVFQTYALYPHMTVRGNMEYPLKVRGFDSDTRTNRVEETAEMLQIADLLDRKPTDLSGGQQQRVALGRAIVREPRIFLLDEPLSNLDQKLRVEMRTELNRLHNQIGKTSLYVTHDQAEAMTLADKIVVMRGGEIQQIDPPQDIYNNPANQFVGQFIGEPKMNFFDSTVERDSDGKTHLVSGSLAITVTEEMVAALDDYRGDRLVLGIRPEHFHLVDESVGMEDTIRANVVIVEEMGSDKHVSLESGAEEYKAIVEGSANVVRGDEIELQLDLDHAHMFDWDTGNSITSA